MKKIKSTSFIISEESDELITKGSNNLNVSKSYFLDFLIKRYGEKFELEYKKKIDKFFDKKEK